jgi:hypothetical protein
MYRSIGFFLAATSALAALPAVAADRTSAKGEADLVKLLGDRVAGKPVNCISLRNSRSSHVIDGTALVYEGVGGTLYVNRPASGADSLRRDDILLTKTFSDQLCNLDTVQLISQGSHFEHGFVSLAQFVPYTRLAH